MSFENQVKPLPSLSQNVCSGKFRTVAVPIRRVVANEDAIQRETRKLLAHYTSVMQNENAYGEFDQHVESCGLRIMALQNHKAGNSKLNICNWTRLSVHWSYYYYSASDSTNNPTWLFTGEGLGRQSQGIIEPLRGESRNYTPYANRGGEKHRMKRDKFMLKQKKLMDSKLTQCCI